MAFLPDTDAGPSKQDNTLPQPNHMMYFGKIPGKGDFVKFNAGVQVVAVLDNWVSQGIELLSGDPQWRGKYDRTEAFDFIFTRTRGKKAFIGSLIASHDASNRRYPFIVFTTAEGITSERFAPRSPLVLRRFLRHTRRWASEARHAAEPVKTLLAIEEGGIAAPLIAEPHEAGYADFLELSDLHYLGHILGLQDGAGLRATILGLAMLLQPLQHNAGGTLYRGMSLPLPEDATHAPLAASLWLDLIWTFIANHDYDLAIYLCTYQGRPQLVVNLAGPTAATFQALFDSEGASDSIIQLAQASWANDCQGAGYQIQTLAHFLTNSEKPLKQLIETFRDLFPAR